MNHLMCRGDGFGRGVGKMKPCPFCGSDDPFLERDRDAKAIYVMCGECGGMGPYSGMREKAVTAWNRRVRTPGIMKAMFGK